MSRRVLVASEYNARDRAHFAQSFEFCSVIADCDDADVLAPGLDDPVERRVGRFLPDHDGNLQRDLNRMANGARKLLGVRNAPVMARAEVTDEYEMFVFVAWSPQSLVELTRIKGWQTRCRIKVAYLFELWVSTLEQDRAYLALLDQFDHVFLLHSACLPTLPRYTRAPCSALPVGVDCLLATPGPVRPDRVIDVYSIGNRSAAVHRELLQRAAAQDFFYVYDTLASSDSLVRDWGEHRLMLTGTIKRSRYFIGFDPASLGGAKAGKVAGEAVLPGRLFEGAAGGAIILGSAPHCPEFAEHFDWADAVVPIAPDGTDVFAVMAELDQDKERRGRARRANARNCLLRHDWAHRWERILATVGVPASPALAARKSRLATAAAGLAEPARLAAERKRSRECSLITP